MGSLLGRTARPLRSRDAGRRIHARAASAPPVRTSGLNSCLCICVGCRRFVDFAAEVARVRAAGRGADAIPGAQEPDVGRGERVGIAAGAQRDVVRGPLADAGQRLQPARPSRRWCLAAGTASGRRPPPARRPAARAGAPPAPAPLAAPRAMPPRRRRRWESSDSGARRRPARPRPAAPQARASAPASCRPASTVTCWPRIARAAISKPSQPPGTRRPGRSLISGASNGSRARCAPIAVTSAPTSNRRRTRAMIAGSARTLGKRTVTARLCLLGQRARPRPCRSRRPRTPCAGRPRRRRCSTPSTARARRCASIAAQS